MKKATNIPLAVGFGISKPEHIKSLIGNADVAVVGSGIINVLRTSGVKEALNVVRDLVMAGM